MPICPRMTLEEVCADMRTHGMSINNQTLSDGIAAGAFKFGTVISVGPTGKRNIVIMRRDYEKWSEEYLNYA